MKNLIKENILFISFSVITGLLNAFSVMMVPFYLNRQLISEARLNFSQATVIIGIMMISCALQLSLIIIRENYAAKYNVANFKSFLEKLFHMDYEESIRNEPTSIVERIGLSTNTIYRFISNAFSDAACNAIIVLSSLFFLLLTNHKIALLLAAALPLNYFGFKKINHDLAIKCETMQSVASSSYKEIFSLWRNTDFVKQFPDSNPLIQKSEPALHAMYESTAHVNKFGQGYSAAIKSANSLIQNISLLITGLSTFYNGAPISSVIILSIILSLYFSSLSAIVSNNLDFSELNTTLSFIEKLDALKEKNSGNAAIAEIHSIDIFLDELPIGDTTKSVNIRTHIRRGDIVKIEGISGSGKSSFVRLLLKFRSCDRILFNGIDIRQLSNQVIRARVKYIPQEPVIFPFSIADNIALGSNNHHKLNSLANNRILMPVLMRKSLDTVLLDNGTNLSGGEKQRISICRAVQDDFDVLILDEITSNLDVPSAQAIYDDIFAQFPDKIIFVITHDQSVSLPVAKSISV